MGSGEPVNQVKGVIGFDEDPYWSKRRFTFRLAKRSVARVGNLLVEIYADSVPLTDLLSAAPAAALIRSRCNISFNFSKLAISSDSMTTH